MPKMGMKLIDLRMKKKKDYERLKVFDFVIGNSDRHLENVLFTDEGKTYAIDHNASLVISKNDDILSFPDAVVWFFSKNVIHDMPHITEIIERFYANKDKILDLINTYVHDHTEMAKLMVESRINYLYTMIKKDKPFPRKYLLWRNALNDEIHNILKRKKEEI